MPWKLWYQSSKKNRTETESNIRALDHHGGICFVKFDEENKHLMHKQFSRGSCPFNFSCIYTMSVYEHGVYAMVS